MLKSFNILHKDVPILISENSTDSLTEGILTNVKVPFIRNIGFTHGPSVNTLLDAINTRYVLLVDTDVIFLKSHDVIFEKFKQMDLTIMGEIVGDRGGKKLHRRVNPWHCFIDVYKIKQNNISFFDEKRMRLKNEIGYDVGSSFFEDIRKANLKIGEFKGNGFYYKHYEGMSWRVGKYDPTLVEDGNIDLDPNSKHCNRGLMEYGQVINDIYHKETAYLNNVELKYEC